MSHSIYIDRRADGKYRVVREGETQPSALSDTQRTAVALARQMRPGAIFVKARATGASWRSVPV